MSAETGWSHRFDDPIVLPDGRELVTLPDAGEYVQALPMTTQQRKGVAAWLARALRTMTGAGAHTTAMVVPDRLYVISNRHGGILVLADG